MEQSRIEDQIQSSLDGRSYSIPEDPLASRLEKLMQELINNGGGGGGGTTITVDSSLSTSSANPVQNKVITAKIQEMITTINEVNQIPDEGSGDANDIFDMSRAATGIKYKIGLYKVGATNTPNNQKEWVIVSFITGTDSAEQIAILNGEPKTEVHFRSCISGTWNGWFQFATKDDLDALDISILDSPAFTGIPTAPTPSDDTNTDQIATTKFVKILIANLINGAPETLDTLKEIADAMAENKDVIDILNKAISNKVDKVEGKGLSTNDFTDEDKSAVYTNPDWLVTSTTSPAYIHNKPNMDEYFKMSGGTIETDGVSMTVDGFGIDGSGVQDLTNFDVVSAMNVKGDKLYYNGQDADERYMKPGSIPVVTSTISGLVLSGENAISRNSVLTVDQNKNPVWDRLKELLLIDGTEALYTEIDRARFIKRYRRSVGLIDDETDTKTCYVIDLGNDTSGNQANLIFDYDPSITTRGIYVRFPVLNGDGEYIMGSPSRLALSTELETAVSDILSKLDQKKANINSPALTGTPTAPTPADSTNTDQIATTKFVKTLVNNLINGAPETLDTLKEVADAIAENETVVQALNEAIGKKINKVDGEAINTFSIDGDLYCTTYYNRDSSAGLDLSRYGLLPVIIESPMNLGGGSDRWNNAYLKGALEINDDTVITTFSSTAISCSDPVFQIFTSDEVTEGVNISRSAFYPIAGAATSLGTSKTKWGHLYCVDAFINSLVQINSRTTLSDGLIKVRGADFTTRIYHRDYPGNDSYKFDLKFDNKADSANGRSASTALYVERGLAIGYCYLGTPQYKWSKIYADDIHPDYIYINGGFIETNDGYLDITQKNGVGVRISENGLEPSESNEWMSDIGTTERPFHTGHFKILKVGDQGSNSYCNYANSYISTDSDAISFYLLNNDQIILFSPSTTYNYMALYAEPDTDKPSNLGIEDFKWTNIFATNGTIQTSDRNEKNSIIDLSVEKALKLIRGSKPSTYMMNEGTSGRIHWGLISQDVEELLDELGWSSLDFAGFIKSPKHKITKEVRDKETGEIIQERKMELIEGEYNYSLRYDEYVSPIIKVEQYLLDKIDDQERRIVDLESKVEQLMSLLK